MQGEKELQTPSIEEAIQTIIGIGEELMNHLNLLASWSGKNKARQYVHAFASGEKDEKTADDILDRLDRARAELNVRIITSHVGISGTIRDGFSVALSIVRRVDENVQRVLGEGLRIAAQLEGRESLPDSEFSSSTASE